MLSQRFIETPVYPVTDNKIKSTNSVSTKMKPTNQKHRKLTLRKKMMALVEKLTLRTTIVPLEIIRKIDEGIGQIVKF